MFIIPIGTKATLALKPAVTIGLIAVNAIVFALTLVAAGPDESKLFDVQREICAEQLTLFLLEHPENIPYGGTVEAAVFDVRRAGDWRELEKALWTAIAAAGADPADYETFCGELTERTDLDFVNRDDGSSAAFRAWEARRAEQQRILDTHVNFALGLVPGRMHRVHTFLTHQFVHGGLMHLLGNMLFLWVVGCLLEDSWGRAPFLAFYLGGGALAGLAHCLQDTSATIPLIGASGAIAAAMGAFTVRHFMTRIRFFYFVIFFFRPLWGTFFLPACVFLPFWFAQQIVMRSIAEAVGGTGVAYLAHIAGYFVGVVTALAFKATGVEENVLAPRVRDRRIREGVAKDPRFERACSLMQHHRIQQARTLFDRLLEASPDDPGLLQDVAAVYRQEGLMEEYGGLVSRALRGLLVAGRNEEASILALDVASIPENPGVNPQYLMRAGHWLAGENRFGEASDVFRAVILAKSSPQVTAKASITLARLLGGPMGYPLDARRVLDEALDLDLDEEWRARIGELRTSIERGSMAELPV